MHPAVHRVPEQPHTLQHLEQRSMHRIVHPFRTLPHRRFPVPAQGKPHFKRVHVRSTLPVSQGEIRQALSFHMEVLQVVADFVVDWVGL